VDWSHLTLGVGVVLLLVLVAEAANGWTDAPCATSAAVASGALTPKQSLWLTVLSNFAGIVLGFLIGAKIAKTIGTGIVRQDMVTVASIGIAMGTIISWSMIALWLKLPISKTHSLLAALAGIGYAHGGFEALMPESGAWQDSGWIDVIKGMGIAILGGSSAAWFLSRVVIQTGMHEKIPEHWWRRLQRVTVCGTGSGHGCNDGLKYYAVFLLVLSKAGITEGFQIRWEVLLPCAFVLAIGTWLGGWRIHQRLDEMVNGNASTELQKKKPFRSHMGVCSEIPAGFLLWQTSWLGWPTSTNHATVSTMAGARSASGKAHISSVVKIIWGWVITYVFCFFTAQYLTIAFQ
jgi:inorganic phosphate transporter, PiT family